MPYSLYKTVTRRGGAETETSHEESLIKIGLQAHKWKQFKRQSIRRARRSRN